jgi:hypothetical protein
MSGKDAPAALAWNRPMTLPRLFSLLESSAVRLAALVLIAGLPISAVTFLAHSL